MEKEEQIPSLWKNKEFIPFIFLRFSLIFALFIQSTSVAYEIFQVTRKELFLGLIGLAEFLPILLTAFYAWDNIGWISLFSLSSLALFVITKKIAKKIPPIISLG